MAASPEALGLVYFSAVKFMGYSAACFYLKRRYTQSTINPLVAGLIRTVIGLIVGSSILFIGYQIGLQKGAPLFYFLLIPLRYFEWFLLLRLFYERPLWGWPKAFKLVTFGVIWSFILDVPAIIALFALPGGFWIC